MIKNTIFCVDLKTILQEETMLRTGRTYRGVLTRDSEDHYLFEEQTRTSPRSVRRNPKLFEGHYVSLVHMQNGRYHVHLRTIDASAVDDRQELAFKVYTELLNALKIID